ncbi:MULTISPECIES: C40 family peptidase [Pasteurellaceae]|uniref:C40 family peptidase n=1 Tax=Pasteurella atlantica TaxID=2827233 RepID=A0AAW8CQG8_9PAST|nr:C40 family peptidase [Pasteurella atlantica]MBR0573678.1 C40 family peptidase [Pasteurella atlantica]MDP8039689.1 C40 family peptidase [Pasteurella atlantica]MDP8041780.1 C40 family peptidase [Pasteurella atlantica]MDP8043946.1 C40 family peptidase [Pasteurella atlantica]MDP8045924.1 C40 family peptidase [Pasteurella atlantica]
MDKLTQQILTHCQKEYPNEACGFVIGDKFYPCKNVADNPQETFVIAEKEWRPEIEVVVHSHPNNEPFLSGADRISQARSGLEWWLICKNQLKKYRYAPLLRGREFKYGKTDCCSIIEDVFMLMGIFDTQFPRTNEQDDIKNQAILHYLEQAGFEQVSTQSQGLTLAQAGDVILTSIQGVANHASFYLGNEKILHHPMFGLSRVEKLGGIFHKAIHSIWRHPDFKPEMMTAVFNDLEASDLWQQ